MDVRITKPNGTTFTLSQYGVKPMDFIVESIQIDPIYEKVEGRSGTIDYGATFGGQRSIRVPFFINASDSHDFPLMRDMIFELMTDLKPFYIEELRMLSGINQLVGGKRYIVRLADTFNIDQVAQVGTSEFTFETTDLPFAESVGTTQDIERNGISADDELWGFGMGLLDDPASHKYTHEGKTFRIYNAGNVPVHPFEQELKITISNVVGSTSYFELKNKTNGTTFHVNEGVTNTQTIVLDGPLVTSNGLAYFRKTNKQFIELEPGWNEFEINGADSARIEFDFRFYYK